MIPEDDESARDVTDYHEATDDGDILGYGDQAVDQGRRAVRVAEDDSHRKKKKKKPKRVVKSAWKARDAPSDPHATTYSIYLLIYFPYFTTFYQDIADWVAQRLHKSTNPADWPTTSVFVQAGIDFKIKKSSPDVWDDLGNALDEAGAVVVYLGHTQRPADRKKADRLRPMPDPTDKSADIMITDLKKLLGRANAKAFVLAGCATAGCLKKIKRDTAIIATSSGKNLLTDTIQWRGALEELFLALVAGSTMQDCIDAANVSFAASTEPDDKFVLDSGKKGMTISS